MIGPSVIGTANYWLNSITIVTTLFSLLISQTGTAAPISVIDDMGFRIELEQPAKRIIALAPHVVENLYSAGAGANIVAAVAYSNYPESAKSLPQVGSYNTFNVEAILARNPDLVVAWRSGNKPVQIEHLRRIGIPVYVSDPRSLEDLAKAVRSLGVLTGHQQHADSTANTFVTQLATLRNKYAGRTPVTALYQVWNKPLQTLNGDHLVSDVLSLCGGRNVFSDAAPIAPKINIEAVIQRNPDAIIASGMGESRPEWLDEWRTVPGLTAVKNDHLFFVPPDIVQRHSLRILQGAQTICDQLEQVRLRKQNLPTQ